MMKIERKKMKEFQVIFEKYDYYVAKRIIRKYDYFMGYSIESAKQQCYFAHGDVIDIIEVSEFN